MKNGLTGRKATFLTLKAMFEGKRLLRHRAANVAS